MRFARTKALRRAKPCDVRSLAARIILSLNHFDIRAGQARSGRMKIAVVGGGPAGLYFAILMKKRRPAAEITVYERNRADDTFGFGVVFSDATLDNFERYD